MIARLFPYTTLFRSEAQRVRLCQLHSHPRSVSLAIMLPTLKQLLAERALARTPTDAWVEWAVDQLMRGQDTPHLRILAGERAPFNAFEMYALFDTVL